MATIDEMQNSMTLFYSKKTGEIKAFSTGIQDMSFFGTDKEDYEIIWDYVVLTKDENVLNNFKSFKVNLSTKTLEILPGAISNYPIATS